MALDLPRNDQNFAAKIMGALVPAALLVAVGSGLTVWREVPLLTDAITRMERTVDRLESRVSTVEVAKYQIATDLKDCQSRIRRIERVNGDGAH